MTEKKLSSGEVTEQIQGWRAKQEELASDEVYASETSFMIPVSRVVPNGWNPNSQNDRTFQRLQDGIDEVGMIDTLTVIDQEDGTYVILGGEHRWRAARSLDMSHVEAKVVPKSEWDEDSAKVHTVTLNIIEGEMTAESFRPLYDEMEGKYGEDALQNLFGFTDDAAYKKLLKDMKKEMKSTLPEELHKEYEDKAKKVKTVDELMVLVENLMDNYSHALDQGLMVFTHGGGKHVYVEMDAEMSRAMSRVTDFLMFSGENINRFMTPVVRECLKRAEKAWEAAEGEQGEDVPY